MLSQGGVILYEKYSALLEKVNKTSYQISKETGISQTAFSNWKSGRSEPSLESLKRLARYFDVPIEYFLPDQKETAQRGGEINITNDRHGYEKKNH